MRLAPFRVVLDTNVLVRAMLNVQSASGKILKACERRELVPLLNRVVLLEYLETLTHPAMLAEYPELEPDRIRTTLERLAYIGDVVRQTRIRFPFPRDPRDAKFVELCAAASATHLISGDPDLLDLPQGHDQTSKRFRRLLPGIIVLTPSGFVSRYAADLMLS